MVPKLLQDLVKKLLLIGDTSLPEALGSKLLRAAMRMELINQWEVSMSYHSPAPNYSPSMKRKRGKAFYRLAGKRSWEWWQYQQQLLNKVEELRPHLVLVTGVLPLDDRIFQEIKRQGGYVVNYLTDDPWNPIHWRRSFVANLQGYNHIFSGETLVTHALGT